VAITIQQQAQRFAQSEEAPVFLFLTPKGSYLLTPTPQPSLDHGCEAIYRFDSDGTVTPLIGVEYPWEGRPEV